MTILEALRLATGGAGGDSWARAQRGDLARGVDRTGAGTIFPGMTIVKILFVNMAVALL